MGRASGTGSPSAFCCHACRRRKGNGGSWSGVGTVKLTGRQRPYKPARHSALGARSCSVSREYTCSCGYTGWSNHAALARAEAFDRPGEWVPYTCALVIRADADGKVEVQSRFSVEDEG